MNKIINKFWLTGDQFMPEVCFTHDAAYSDSKDLAMRTILNKILKGRAYKIARSCNHDEH